MGFCSTVETRFKASSKFILKQGIIILGALTGEWQWTHLMVKDKLACASWYHATAVWIGTTRVILTHPQNIYYANIIGIGEYGHTEAISKCIILKGHHYIFHIGTMCRNALVLIKLIKHTAFARPIYVTDSVETVALCSTLPNTSVELLSFITFVADFIFVIYFSTALSYFLQTEMSP